jgi:F0F1-type ATP synthase assembly protein I
MRFFEMGSNNINKNNKRRNSKSNIIRELAPYSTLGIQLVLTIGLGAFAGWKIDEYYNTSPIFLIILTFMGAIAGMVSFIRTVTSRNKKKK